MINDNVLDFTKAFSRFSVSVRRSFGSQTMFKQTATDLTKISEENVRTWVNSFDTVLTDCDGKFCGSVEFFIL